ncbi:MAG: nucleotidyltransferase family protein [Dethiobacter sp.]|nr:nucleotidyltransferase family protein [Dethiobacter sp.]MBS3989011.1 nucleotidyltransferase family protein [Dethiobacter sp.]
MMSRFEIEEIIKKHKPILHEKFKVKSIGIFGSYARNQETDKSDIDILVSFREPVGWEFVDLKEYLENLFGKKVDLVTEGALKPQLKDAVLREVVYQ